MMYKGTISNAVSFDTKEELFAYQQGRADTEEFYKPLLELVVSFNSENICIDMNNDYCGKHCEFDCPQKECYLEWLKEKAND